MATADYSARANAATDVAIRYNAPADGSIAVAVDDEEGFAADNRRFLVLEPASHGTVLLVTSGANDSGFYVARALGATADRGEQRLDARVASSASLARDLDNGQVALARFSTIVLLSTRALDRRVWGPLAEFVRSGGGILIAAAPEVDPAVVSAMFSWRPALDVALSAPLAVTLSPTDVRHPIFRPFGTLTANLGQVRFERAWRVKSDGWDLIARFTDGTPALLERREGQGRVVLFASDLDRRWNDFPLHPAFVPFALESMQYVAGARDRGRDYLVGASPAGVAAIPGVTAHRATAARLPSMSTSMKATWRRSHQASSRRQWSAWPGRRATAPAYEHSSWRHGKGTGNMDCC